MRIAVVSDIHGNLTALEAVIADLRETAPDLVLHGGDIAGPGSNPIEVVDRIRELAWPGVLGNTDEMLFRPESLTAFADGVPSMRSLFDAVGEMADWMRGLLGRERLDWLSALPLAHTTTDLALFHARPGDTWRPPADDGELEALGRPLAVYGHTHCPFIRSTGTLTVANSGSAGQPLDGDRRACYLLIHDGQPAIRRVEYDVTRELRALERCGIPHAEWIGRTIGKAAPIAFRPA